MSGLFKRNLVQYIKFPLLSKGLVYWTACFLGGIGLIIGLYLLIGILNMSFQKSVSKDMPPGKQNAHLIAYQQNGKVDSFILNSSRVNSSGNVDLDSIRQEIQQHTNCDSKITILGVSPLGAQ